MTDTDDRHGPRSAKRVGLVAYYFPPVGGVAVARTMGFVRHLPAAGWTPVVIASKGSSHGLVDADGAARLSRSIEVHRAWSPEPGHLRRFAVAVGRSVPVRRVLPRRGAGRGAPAQAAAIVPPPGPVGVATVEPTASRTPSWPARIRSAVWFPDDRVGWLPFALSAIVAAHRRDRLDVIESSSSPITAHLAAGIASLFLRVPWVADFRDPWVDSPIDPPGGRLDRWRRRRVEAWITRRADRVIFATPSLRENYARRYPSRAARFLTIENGYEASDLRAVSHAEPSPPRPRRLVYAGSLYRPAEVDTFLAGVGLLARRMPDLADHLQIEFIGYASPGSAVAAAVHLADPAVASIVTFVPFLPRREALGRLAEADGALTLLGPGPGMDVFVGAKLFDALGLDLQVVAILPPGDARTILASLDWGIVGDPTADGVADALARFLDAPKPDRSADPERRYDRANLAARLAAVLDDVVDGTPPTPHHSPSGRAER